MIKPSKDAVIFLRCRPFFSKFMFVDRPQKKMHVHLRSQQAFIETLLSPSFYKLACLITSSILLPNPAFQSLDKDKQPQQGKEV